MSSTRARVSARLLVLSLVLLSAAACGDNAVPTTSLNAKSSAFIGTWELFEVYGEPLLFIFSDTRWGCDIDDVSHPGTSFERVRSGLLELDPAGAMHLDIVMERRCVTEGGVDSGWSTHTMSSHGQYAVDGSRLWLEGSEQAELAGGQLQFIAGGQVFMRWKKR